MQKTAIKKTQKSSFSTPGTWVEKPRRSEVLVCSACKGKYIKTRAGQTTCVRCISRPVVLKK